MILTVLKIYLAWMVLGPLCVVLGIMAIWFLILGYAWLRYKIKGK